MGPQSPNSYSLQLPKNDNGNKIVSIVLGVLLILAIAVAGWAFKGKLDADNNLQAKIDAAVVKAKADQAVTLQAAFDEKSKLPTKTFTGPETYGTVSFSYPKSWSVYNNSGSQPLDLYFQPDIVSSINGTTKYALRAEILSSSYSDVVATYQSLVSSGKITSTAYVPDKLKSNTSVQAGVKLDGDVLSTKTNISMVIVRLRDKTLKLYTQSSDSVNDFNNTVLPSLNFVP